MTKRILGLLLCFALCAALLPTAMAEDITIVGDGALDVPSDDEITVVPAPDAETLASGSCGSGVSWSLDAAGTLTISGSGNMTDYSTSSHAPWYSYRSSVKKLVVDSGVRHLGAYALYGCNSMTEAEIDPGVRTLGEGAFYCCIGLTKLSFPGMGVGAAPAQPNAAPAEPLTKDEEYAIGDWCFYGCSALAGTLSFSQFDKIGQYAFADCTSLEALSFTWASPLEIGYSAFAGCTSLKSGGFDAAVIGPRAFADCTSLEDLTCYCSTTQEKYFTSIGYSAFENCVSLKSFEVPDYVTEIGSNAFYGCTALEEVTLGGALQSIGQRAFRDCTALKDVHFYGFVPEIGSESFRGVRADAYYYQGLDWTGAALTSYGGTLSWHVVSNRAGEAVTWTATKAGALTLTGSGAVEQGGMDDDWCGYLHLQATIKQAGIGSGITSLGYSTFRDMDVMTAVSLPGTLTEIDSLAFFDCEALESVAVPNNVTRIRDSAFEYCDALRSVSLGSGLQTIGKEAFHYCKSLESVTVPNSVTSIGEEAFSRCCALRSLSLGSGLQKIGKSAFSECESLPSVTIPAAVTEIGNFAFSYCSALTTVRFEGAAPEFSYESYNDKSTCFHDVVATVWYPAGEPSWTAAVRQQYGGTLTWKSYTPGSGYAVTVTDMTNGKATASIDSGSYSGSLSFTVSSTGDRAVLVLAKSGNTYSVLSCTTSGGKHNFTLNVTADTEIILVFRGDATLDGKVNMRDSLAIKKHVAGTETLSGTALRAANADGDSQNKVNMRDSLAVKKDVAGTDRIKW